MHRSQPSGLRAAAPRATLRLHPVLHHRAVRQRARAERCRCRQSHQPADDGVRRRLPSPAARPRRRFQIDRRAAQPDGAVGDTELAADGRMDEPLDFAGLDLHLSRGASCTTSPTCSAYRFRPCQISAAPCPVQILRTSSELSCRGSYATFTTTVADRGVRGVIRMAWRCDWRGRLSILRVR